MPHSSLVASPVKAVANLGSLRINGARLWRSLMELAEIGATAKGGVRRLALTDLDRQGRDRLTNIAVIVNQLSDGEALGEQLAAVLRRGQVDF